jgi:hypothetical protein
MDSAGDAFTSALGNGFIIAAAVALVAAVITKLWLPARHAEEVMPLAPVPAAA